jgi:tRNA-2-methylthio-N6-dimethylallyladenosine synthase
VIEDLQERILTEANAHLQGQTFEVLVEGRKRGRWFGRNRNDKLVFFEHEEDQKSNLVDVKINKTSAWSLQGTLVS